jgi:hypothetical protein
LSYALAARTWQKSHILAVAKFDDLLKIAVQLDAEGWRGGISNTLKPE